MPAFRSRCRLFVVSLAIPLAILVVTTISQSRLRPKGQTFSDPDGKRNFDFLSQESGVIMRSRHSLSPACKLVISLGIRAG